MRIAPAIRPYLLLCSLLPALPGAGVKVLFDPASPSVGPFPTDALTVPDRAQKTGLRINLPTPDCQAEPSTCAEIAELNALDGFSLEPRLRIRFSGPINPDTLRDGVFLVWLQDLTSEEFGLQPTGSVTPINTVMYDPATYTAYAEPDEILSQHRQYALVVTDAVRDPAGAPVETDVAFTACAARTSDYCGKLASALAAVSSTFAPRRIVGASVFTTLSATAWLEGARAALQSAPFNFQRARPKSIFGMADLASIVYHAQTGYNPKAFTDYRLNPLPGDAVGQIAFGSFVSPVFMNERFLIPAAPTGTRIDLPAATAEIVFCAWLPKTAAPATGYPVVIVGHGSNAWHIRNSSFIAAALAEQGLATIAVNAAGHGFGPESTLVLTDKASVATELKAGGRGADSGAAMAPTLLRDVYRQTTVDTMQLVRAIKAGIDLDGNGTVDLDRNRIYYQGQSMGSLIGAILHAVEPDVRAAVLSDPGATQMDVSRLGKTAIGVILLSTRTPSLLNAGTSFDAAYALRYQAPKIVDVPGAIAVQEFFERVEWMSMSGDPLAFAPHLKSSTLPGVPIKPTLFQIAFGDRTVPNPAGTSLVRAANMRESTSLYRHDLARAVVPALAANPHMIFFNPPASAEARAIWEAGQKQIAEFLASDGVRIVYRNDLVQPLFRKDLFELPLWLPEDMNY